MYLLLFLVLFKFLIEKVFLLCYVLFINLFSLNKIEKKNNNVRIQQWRFE